MRQKSKEQQDREIIAMTEKAAELPQTPERDAILDRFIVDMHRYLTDADAITDDDVFGLIARHHRPLR